MTGQAGQRSTLRKPDQALERSEERFRLLVESVIDYAIFMLDPSGIVQTWNAGAERLKGYREDEIVGQHYSVFYPEESRQAGLPERLLATARAEGHALYTGWRVRKDGTRFWADVAITALYDDHGKHTGYAKVTRDRTEAHDIQEAREEALAERKRAVERLQELNRWHRDFIGSVVHDLQTPVTSVTAFTEMLLDDNLDEADRRESLERILSNARSLQELINNLRTYTRLDAGRVELRPAAVPLRRFVAGLTADMRPTFGARHVEIDVDDARVWADPHGLERILRNLLSNAARHTPSRAGLHVRARLDGDHVRVDVRDEGAGIPPELRDRIFDRFESGTTGGTGLGLSIAKQYVELHGGVIGVDSEVGKGSTFWFTLPRAQPDPAG